MLLNICITELDEVGLNRLRARRLVLVRDRWFGGLNSVSKVLNRVEVLRGKLLSTRICIRPYEKLVPAAMN